MRKKNIKKRKEKTMENAQQPVNPAMPAKKSNVTLITGIIGFVLGIPNILCATICAAAAAVGAGVDEYGNVSESDIEAAAAGAGVLLWILVIIPTIVGFVTCFFGKSPKAKTTGIIMAICGALIAISGFFISWLGLAVGALYIFGGVSSIKNSSIQE